MFAIVTTECTLLLVFLNQPRPGKVSRRGQPPRANVSSLKAQEVHLWANTRPVTSAWVDFIRLFNSLVRSRRYSRTRVLNFAFVFTKQPQRQSSDSANDPAARRVRKWERKDGGNGRVEASMHREIRRRDGIFPSEFHRHGDLRIEKVARIGGKFGNYARANSLTNSWREATRSVPPWSSYHRNWIRSFRFDSFRRFRRFSSVRRFRPIVRLKSDFPSKASCGGRSIFESILLNVRRTYRTILVTRSDELNLNDRVWIEFWKYIRISFCRKIVLPSLRFDLLFKLGTTILETRSIV